jgi:hypothetical protein
MFDTKLFGNKRLLKHIPGILLHRFFILGG